MKVIREDEGQLIFLVYPTKHFLLFSLFMLIISVYMFFHPPAGLSTVARFPIEPITGQFLAIFSIIIFSVNLIMSYVVPIQVIVDRLSGKLTYRDFRLLPNHLRTKYTEELQISQIKKLLYTTHMPEYRFGSYKRQFEIGKCCFILADNTSIPIYVSTLSYTRHDAAFKKIATYLAIPYINESASSSSSPSHAPSWGILKIMIIIMIVLALIVAALIGLASLA